MILKVPCFYSSKSLQDIQGQIDQKLQLELVGVQWLLRERTPPPPPFWTIFIAL